MNILREDLAPLLYIAPRYKLASDVVLKFVFTNEGTGEVEEILSNSALLISNETTEVELLKIPDGKTGDKFSYIATDNVTSSVVCFGKAMLVSENEDIQDYSRNSTNNFYKQWVKKRE